MNTFHILQKLAALKRNEKASVLQLHQMQERQLRTVLSYAYEHSPYYKAAFEAAGLTAESIQTAPLSAFPTLDKATLLSRFDEIITVPDVTQEELRHFDAEEDADRKPYKGKYHVGYVHASDFEAAGERFQDRLSCRCRVKGLLDYQFRQIENDSFEMLAETAEDADKDSIRHEMLQRMRTILLKKDLGYVQFYIQFVRQIAPDPQTGKKKLVIPQYAGKREQEVPA